MPDTLREKRWAGTASAQLRGFSWPTLLIVSMRDVRIAVIVNIAIDAKKFRSFPAQYLKSQGVHGAPYED